MPGLWLSVKCNISKLYSVALTVLQSRDELFLLPSTLFAIPRAYWLGIDDPIKNQLLDHIPRPLEFPNPCVFKNDPVKIPSEGLKWRSLISCTKIASLPFHNDNMFPSRRNFRVENRSSFLGKSVEPFDPDLILDDASFVHSSE